MATRRNVSNNLTSGEEKEKEFKPVKGEKSNIAPAVPAFVFPFPSSYDPHAPCVPQVFFLY
jgi:hypothetical protein